MKNILFLALLFISLLGYAQETQNVGIGTASPDKSAVLDIQSQNKGLLIPRLSMKQREAILNPAEGLLVYQTDGNKSGFFYFNGTQWNPLQDQNAIATVDANGWALDGNTTTTANKMAADTNSFIGTPSDVPINFRIGAETIGKFSSNNLYLGLEAGKNSSDNASFDNVGLGNVALSNTKTAIGNVAIGSYTLNNFTSGISNIAIGGGALEELTMGSLNVAIGKSSLASNQFGMNNLAIGYYSGAYNTGDNNMYLGTWAGSTSEQQAEEFNKLYISHSSDPLIYGDFAYSFITIGNIPKEKRDSIAISGNYGLLVKKGILAERVKVALSSTAHWADYVFEEDYKKNMMSLPEIEQFTLKNKHLPNVPSAAEMVENGLDVTETSRMFMEKIEELTLHLIEMNKKVQVLESTITSLKKEKLKKRKKI